MTNNQDELREKLAAIEHERWADWQKWMHSVLRRSGELTEGADEILKRWDKQINTPYSQLSDQEKASDMDQVDRYWPLIQEYVTQAVATAEREARIDELEKFELGDSAYRKRRIGELQQNSGEVV